MTPYDAHLHVHPGAPAAGCVAAGDPAELRNVVAYARRNRLHLALGVHPWWAASTALDDLRALLDDTVLDGVGECGLDRLRGDQEAQERGVVAHLSYARERSLPVVFHCVRAHDRLLALLDEPVAGLVHGYTGSAQQAERFVERGLHVSFGRALLGSAKIRDAACAVPDDRLLVESDAEQPTDVLAEVTAALAELRGWSIATTVRKTHENARALFPRDPTAS